MPAADIDWRATVRYWRGWTSPFLPAWLWHAVFDGTPLCRCAHSAEYRESRTVPDGTGTQRTDGP
jgi:hypothetical protein